MKKLSTPFQNNSPEEFLFELHRTLTDEVNDYLELKGISRTQFAEKLGVSKSYVSQLLNGRGDTKFSSLANLANAMGKVPHLVFSDMPLQPYAEPDDLTGFVSEPKKNNAPKPLRDKVNWDDLTLLPELARCSKLKKSIDALRPFDKRMEAHILQQYLRIWNYNSNAIEGNQLTYGETEALLLYGVTAKGKPLKDHLDVIGHRDAVDLMMAMVKGERGITQADLRQLHQVMLKEDYQQTARTPGSRMVYRTIRVGVYKREPNHVIARDGKKHYYAEPSAVPGQMGELLDWYDDVEKEGNMHPLLMAAIFHHEFVAIHPFDDGNGRVGRILMNFILMRGGYPLTVIDVDSRDEYYTSLMAADKENYVPLVKFIGERLLNSLDIQLTTARGEDIGGSKWDT